MQRVWKREDTGLRATNLRGVLVAIAGNEVDETVIRMACKMVKNTKTVLHVTHVIEMPWTSPVDGSPSEETMAEADEILRHAAEVASACGYPLEPELLQARAAGPAIVDEATSRDCDLILLGLPYKKEYGHFTMGETVPYVLGSSPTQVWVIRGLQH